MKIKIDEILKKSALISLAAFFTGRLVIFQNLNPIAPAFLSLISSEGVFFYLGAAMTILGLLSQSGFIDSIKYIIGIIILSGCVIFTDEKKFEQAPLIKSAYGFISAFVSGLIISVFSDFSFYYFVMAVLEAVLCFCLSSVMEKGRNEKIALITGCMICGANLEIGFLYLPITLCVLCVMVMVYNFGLSSLSGIILMLIPSLACSVISSEMLAVFMIPAVTAGIIGKKNKPLFMLIYILSALIVCIFIAKQYPSAQSLMPILIGAAIFPFTGQISKREEKQDNRYSSYIKEITSEKLRNFSDTFARLSRTFMSLCDDERQTDISPIVDEISQNVCQSCGSREFCWEKRFYATYRKMFLMLRACDKNGLIENDETEIIFDNECENTQKLTEIVNKLYEVYKTKLEWIEKMKESRKIVSKQLSAVAESAKKLYISLNNDIVYDSETTESIKKMLTSEGINFESVIASDGEKKQVIIKLKASYNCGKCKKITETAALAAGYDMCRSCEQCVINDGICTLELEKENLYRITTGVSEEPKRGNEKSGDSFSFMRLPNSKYMLALADGMGSGDKASQESAASIELFENFMSAGFDKKTALDIINSVLVLRSTQDRLSTLDLFIFDLKTGIAEFTKTGAAATFIKNGNMLERLQASSLPIGILPYVLGETKVRRMKDGDIIIMVSDGVTDSFKSINDFENYIRELDIKNPQRASKEILRKAEELGNYADDMTVIVSKIRKAK